MAQAKKEWTDMCAILAKARKAGFMMPDIQAVKKVSTVKQATKKPTTRKTASKAQAKRKTVKKITPKKSKNSRKRVAVGV